VGGNGIHSGLFGGEDSSSGSPQPSSHLAESALAAAQLQPTDIELQNARQARKALLPLDEGSRKVSSATIVDSTQQWADDY
jgi:hypothetical protein